MAKHQNLPKNKYSQMLSNFVVELTYNFTRIKDEIEYKRLPNISEHIINLNMFKNITGKQYLFNSATISGNLNYYSNKTITAPTSEIQTFIPEYYQVNISKKININDDIKYKIVIGKTIKEKFDMNIFLVNNNKKNGVGFGISTTF